MRILKQSLLLGVILLGLVAAARADVIKGRVVDAQNRPISNAEILVHSTLGKNYSDNFSALRADAQGNFSADLPLGKYHTYGQFFAVAPGMAPNSIALKSNSSEKVNIIQLQPATIISGTVQDQKGKAAAGVTVQLRSIHSKSTSLYVFLFRSPWEKRYQTKTDQNGHWQLKALPAGTQASVRFTDPRFVSTEIQVSTDKPSTTKLDPGATFTGRVVDETGKPEANVKVTAEAHGNFATSLSWGEATTATDGSYKLTGLSTGAYDIIVDAGEKPLVAAALENKTAHQGQSENLPDLILTSGGIITGQVLNSNTGKPVAWASVGCYGPQRPRSGSMTSADTDAEGRYSLRVAPGKSYVYMAGIAPEYIHKYNEGFTVAVKKDETVTHDFHVKLGATLSGIVVDRQGNALADVPVQVIDEKLTQQNVYDQPTSWRTITDSEGRWNVQGLTSGIMKVDVVAPWASIASVQVSVPHTGDVRLYAEKVSDLSPVTRVVDYENKPLPDVNVSFVYKKSATEVQGGSATSDANGYVRVKLPDAIESVSLAFATSPGYSFESGGIWNAATKTLSDIVLDRLDNSVQGKVFTQQGQPATAANVWMAGFDGAVTQTDKNGAFTLTGLPHRDITLLAVGKNGVSKITLQRGQQASLQLAPLPQNHFPSQAQSLDMLEQIYHDTSSKTLYAHSSIPYHITKYDFQRGIDLLKDGNGKIPGGSVYGVFYLLKEKKPAAALQWGEEHLGEITNNRMLLLMLCDLAKLAYPTDQEKAQKYFSEAVEMAQKIPAPQEKTYTSDFQTTSPITQFINSRAYVAGAAAVVDPSQTGQWVAQTLPYTVAPDQNNRYAWARDIVAQYLGANAPEQTELLVKNSTGRAKSTVLKSAIEAAVMAGNSELAERWLHQLLALYQNGDTENPNNFSSSSVYDIGQSARLVIESVGAKNPAHALQIARMLDDSSQTAQSLMVAAYYQPDQIKLKTLKEAFDLSWPLSGEYLARIAGMVYDISPAEGKVLFDRLLQRYNQQQGDSSTYIALQVKGANLAYFLARYKPLASWRILQSEYAKAKSVAEQTGYADTDVVIAMSALSFDEAMQWAKQMPTPKGRLFDAQRKLLEIALDTPAVRRVLFIDRLDMADSWISSEPARW